MDITDWHAYKALNNTECTRRFRILWYLFATFPYYLHLRNNLICNALLCSALQVRLYSELHPGYFMSTATALPAGVAALLRGIPHHTLLQLKGWVAREALTHYTWAWPRTRS